MECQPVGSNEEKFEEMNLNDSASHLRVIFDEVKVKLRLQKVWYLIHLAGS